MAAEWSQFVDLTPAQRAECERIAQASGSEWWRVQKGDLPSFIPPRMKDKLDGGTWIASGSTSGVVYLVFAADRVDAPVDNIDVHPFGMIVAPTGASTAMAIIHHGEWTDRATTIPADFWAVAQACATGSYFYAKPPDGKTSGSLDELSPRYQGAFDKMRIALSGSYSTGTA